MNQSSVALSEEERNQILGLFRQGLSSGQVFAQLGWSGERYPQLVAIYRDYLVFLVGELRGQGKDDLTIMCRLLGWSESEQTRTLIERLLQAQEILRWAGLTMGGGLPTSCDFAALLACWRPSEQEICLALGTQGPILTGPGADQLGNVAVVGATGGGKSVVLRLLLAQLASLFPRSCYLISPHFAPLLADGTDWRSIQPLLGAQAQEGEEIAALLQWVERELQERRRREMTGDSAWRGQRIYIVLDELAEVVRRDPSAATSLAALLQGGRAFGISVILTAQEKPPWVDPASIQTAYFLGGDTSTAATRMRVGAEVPDPSLLDGSGGCLLRYAGSQDQCAARVPHPSNAAVRLLCEGTAVDD